MKKLLFAVLLTVFSPNAIAEYQPKPDIIKTTQGELDAFGVALFANKQALTKLDFKTTEQQAKQGDKQAQFLLAKMYELGIHTQKDMDKAIEWYKKSAENGYPLAMNNLATHLNGGYSDMGELNPDSLIWYQKAVEQNQPHAMINLSAYYLFNKQHKDIEKGIALLSKASEMGFAVADYSLYLVYDDNELGKKDEEKAFKYLKQSAERGYAEAQYVLSSIYMMGLLNPDPTDRIQPLALAYRWAKRACVNGLKLSCERVEYISPYATLDLNEFQEQCKKGDKKSCEDYDHHKKLQDEMNKVDE